MRIFEITLAILSFVAFLINLFMFPSGGILLTIAMLLLSCFYFCFSFAYFNGIKLKGIFNNNSYKGISVLRIVGTVVFGFSISVLNIALLFNIFNWPTKSILTAFGLFCVLIVLFVGSWKYGKNHSKFYVKIFKRIVILGVPSLILLIMPHLITDIKYRNYPEYLEALYKMEENPYDLQYCEQAEIERVKMFEDLKKK